MWTLECEGDVLNGKKIWLRPGTNHLFGRTKPPAGEDDRAIIIDNKSVSRKHLIISVAPVAPGSGTRLDTRAELQLTDKSKIGTTIDGRKIKEETTSLSGNEHTVQLGSFGQKFKIKWFPVVITPASLSKRSRDPVAEILEQIEAADIKLSLDYVVEQTTHVVAAKRNFPKCLQALINAKHLVTSAYLDAVERATSLGSAESSALEEDFDANWPDPMRYVPPPGKEPNPRNETFFEPDPKRLDVFGGFTFVFFDQAQFDQLGEIVNNGGGKAHFYEMVRGRTTAKTLVDFVKTLNAKKLVVVRFPRNEGSQQWMIDFLRDAELALGQRAMEQNEFLGAILDVDPAPLKRPLEEEMVIDSSMPSARQQTQAAAAGVLEQGQENRNESIVLEDDSGTAAPAAAPSRGRTAATEPPQTRRKTYRTPYKSKFAGFDDFDPSQLAKDDASIDDYGEDEVEVGMDDPLSQVSRSGVNGEEFQSQPPQASQPAPAAKSRKRPHDLSDAEDSKNLIDSLMPAAAAMKKRRIGSAPAEGPQAGSTAKPKSAAAKAAEHLRRVRERGDKEIDVKALAAARREEQEKRAQEEQERLQEAMEETDVARLRNLALVEEWDVELREPPRRDQKKSQAAPTTNGHVAGGWDDRWNGRKDFKKFRKVRRGATTERPTAPRKVIVGLEEVKKKDFGIGEDYWLEGGSAYTSSRDRERDSRRSGDATFTTSRTHSQRSSAATRSRDQSQQQSNAQSQSEASAGARASVLQSRTGAAARQVIREEEDEEPLDVELEDVTQTMGRSQQKQGSVSSRPAGERARGKRKADAPPVAPPAAKKRAAVSRSVHLDDNDDDDDEDDEDGGLKFRFRRAR